MGVPGRRVLGGVLEQVDEHLLDEQPVDRHERQIGRQDATSTSRPRSWSSMRSSAAPTTSSSGCHSLCTLSAPASSRVMSSRLRTSRLSRWASS